MAKRKTILVEDLVGMVNKMLKDSEPSAKGIRRGAMSVLEQVLHDTGNYKGFRYLYTGECDGPPGVHFEDGKMLDYPARFVDTDDTRVQY